MRSVKQSQPDPEKWMDKWVRTTDGVEGKVISAFLHKGRVELMLGWDDDYTTVCTDSEHAAMLRVQPHTGDEMVSSTDVEFGGH